jgi:hypothetical protein
MVVQLLVVVRPDVASREHFFEVPEKGGIHRHHVLEMAVNRAVLHHQDLAVAFEDRRLDFADLLIQQDADVLLAVENFLSRLAHARRAERVGLARPAQWRLGLLVGLEQGFVRPPRGERRTLRNLVQTVEHDPGAVGGEAEPLFEILDGRVHAVVSCEERERGCAGQPGDSAKS